MHGHAGMKTSGRLISIATLLGAAACARAEAAPSPAPSAEAVTVTTVEVAEKIFPKTTLLSGSVVANQRAEVAADTAGKVLEARVERGDVVKQGELLVRLDTRDSALGAAEASAALAAARTGEQHQRLECERSEKLLAQRVISRSEFDRQKAACEASVASTRAAAARAARAGKQVGDGRIVAPFSGVVVERAVSKGDFVAPGRPVVVLVQRDPLRVELSVPEAAVAKVVRDQVIAFSVAPLPAERFRATVRFVGPVIDAKSRNLTIEALVASDDPRLLPGMFATARLPVGEQRLLAVPPSAVAGTRESPRVFVVVDGTVQERVVQLGEPEGDRVAVLKGLRAGERVVVKPTAAVVDGARVK